MSETYTKLFTSITVSTIWQEPMETRLTWITMLAMADQNGDVYASIPGLARMANVPMDKVELALTCLLAPDPYSRSKENDGRRIEEIDGGWRLLNHSKFHAIRMEAERAAYKREWDRQNRPSGAARQKADDPSPTQSDSSPTKSDTPTISDRPDPPDQTRLLPDKASKSKDRSSSVASRRPQKTDCSVSRPFEVGEQTWNDWLTLRRAKKAPVTETVLASARDEAAKAGLTLESFFAVWCARGSQGLQADWLKASERATTVKGKPSAADNFLNKTYTGTLLEDLPEDLRPKSEAM